MTAKNTSQALTQAQSESRCAHLRPATRAPRRPRESTDANTESKSTALNFQMFKLAAALSMSTALDCNRSLHGCVKPAKKSASAIDARGAQQQTGQQLRGGSEAWKSKRPRGFGTCQLLRARVCFLGFGAEAFGSASFRLGLGSFPKGHLTKSAASRRLWPQTVKHPRPAINFHDPKTSAKMPPWKKPKRKPRHLGFGPWGFQHQASNGGLNRPELSACLLPLASVGQ